MENKMADTIGSLIDKICTVNQKMFLAQEDIYIVRKMTFEEFKTTFANNDEKLKKLYDIFKKATDLNIQRQAMILELDKKIIEVISVAIKGENLDNGAFIQDQHKTY
jgi:hypothetical protein